MSLVISYAWRIIGTVKHCQQELTSLRKRVIYNLLLVTRRPDTYSRIVRKVCSVRPVDARGRVYPRVVSCYIFLWGELLALTI